MRVRIVDDMAALAELAADWQRLWLMQPRRYVFMHLAWMQIFWDSYAAGKRLHCLIAEDSDGIQGILPLFRSNDGGLRFLGDPRSDYSDLLCPPERAIEVTEIMVACLRRERGLTLSAVPESALLLASLKQGLAHPFEIAVEEPCPVIELDREGAVAATLLRKESLRRHEKKVAKLGPVSLEKIPAGEPALQMLPVLFEQHIQRWQTTRSPSMFLQPEHRRFYERLVMREELHQALDFRLVRAGDRVVASHLGFFEAGRFLWYKPTFDSSLSVLGPGEVLLKLLLAAAAAEGACEFDFTRGNEGFKQRFATSIRHNHVIRRPTHWQWLRARAVRVRQVWSEARARPLQAAGPAPMPSP